MNGNISIVGITADLEWMHRVGIGGMQIFDVDLRTPEVVKPSVRWMSPEWQAAFRHAGAEAERLGLEMGMATSGGWSESGSPWVTPAQAMKRVVWSETAVQGPRQFTGVVPVPPNATHIVSGPDGTKDSVFYIDTKVLAFPVPDGDSTGPRVVRLREKAQYVLSRPDGQTIATPSVAPGQAIVPQQIVDLTSSLHTDGTLAWNVPAGKWVILRIGYTLTGSMSRFGTRESSGLEVDKLSRAHVDTYIHDYVQHIADALGPSFGKSFQYLLMDSWEAGAENWTDDMIAEFTKRRGYDPTPYLPVLAGRIVGSSETSDRFLRDFRRTIADLVSDHHYGEIERYARARGLKGVYAEAIGVEQPTDGDGLQAKGQISVPMGEFVLEPWRLPGGRETNRADLREAASAAHIYGKPLVGAESFTTTEAPAWGQAPYDLKAYADWAMAAGVNQFVIHTSAHQPFTDDAHKPGITLADAGQNYTRTNTWGEQSVAFNTYLARGSYLLQQGTFVGDIAYYYGDDAPVVVPYWKAITPTPPVGYDYDWLNTDVLLTKLSVRDNRLVLPSGMQYRLLVIPNDVTSLTLPALRKIRDLVAAGATLIAPRPVRSPTLSDGPAADDSVRAIADSMWGAPGGFRRYHEPIGHRYGKGMVYSGHGVQEILEEMNVAPDFLYSRPVPDDSVVWIHRRAGDTDIYFVANQRPRPMDVVGQFRVTGKEAELWHLDDGSIEPASYTIDSLTTTVPMHLDPRGSMFVVFRNRAATKTRTVPATSDKSVWTARGGWTVTFPPNWGAPPSIRLDSLTSWTASADPGVKYFSGTATYSRTITVPASWLTSNARLLLDLGVVKEIAEVSVNGTPVGILWKPPFRTDVTKALKAGVNRIEVKVTNLWPNRMIGDVQPGTAKKYTFAIIEPYEKGSPLLDSGLLGPVQVIMRSGQRK